MRSRGLRMTSGLAVSGLVALALAGGLFSCGGGEEAAGPDTVVSVNGDPINKSELELLWVNLPEAEREDYAGPEGVKKLIEEMVTYRLMAQEAERRKLDEDPAVKEQIEVLRRQVLVNALVSRSISQADLFEYFQRNFVRLRFIQIGFAVDAGEKDKKAALAKAQKLHDEFTEESDFSELAREHSSADNAIEGGEMGYVTYDTVKNMVGIQASEMVRRLGKPGAITEPVEGKDGWYIFQLVEPSGQLDHRGLSEDLEGAIRSIKNDEVIRSFSNELNTRKENVITYNEPVIREIMETVRQNMELFKDVEEGSTVSPGTTASPGDTSAPAPGSTAGPAPGSTAAPGATP